ncbi:MAG: hypothetical protein BMS9Abin37_0669 [Acidobacteriota bacterium]|nr:MAG: hypothetical protein BMS9Abin37_0669 [Acidobacteriota bacterium]
MRCGVVADDTMGRRRLGEMIERTIRILNEMKQARVIEDYAIGGAIGALFYIEPIETHDLDIFAALPESASGLVTLDGIYRYLQQRGYQPEGEHVVIGLLPISRLLFGLVAKEADAGR